MTPRALMDLTARAASVATRYGSLKRLPKSVHTKQRAQALEAEINAIQAELDNINTLEGKPANYGLCDHWDDFWRKTATELSDA